MDESMSELGYRIVHLLGTLKFGKEAIPKEGEQNHI